MHYRHHCDPGGYSFGGRHRHRGGSGPFGWGFGGSRGGGFSFGRMLKDGDLRLLVLALIEEQPRHGYDIIKAFEDRSAGFYSPSPGVIYPTLTYLEEAGYVTSEADGNKKTYSISETGTSHLDENRASVEAILSQMKAFGQKMGRARDWFERGDGSRSDSPTPQTEAAEALDQARRRLRALIVAATEGTDADQQRVADILTRASDEILGKGGEH